MSTITNVSVKPIENENKNQKTVKKNKEKKQIGVGGAVVLGTSLAALASVGTYVVMRGKCKKIGKKAEQAYEFLQGKINKLEINLNTIKKEKEDLKRQILSKDDFVEEIKANLEKKSEELLRLKKDLNSKNEKIKILENQSIKKD